MCVGSIAVAEKLLAAFEDIAPGGIEVTGVPRIGYIARPTGEVEQTYDFAFGVSATDVAHIADVPFIHAHKEIEAVVVVALQLTCGLARAGDAVFGQLPAGRRIDVVAQLLGGSGGRFDVEVGIATSLVNKVFHHKFCHWTAADISVADEDYSEHDE